jgi:hypothetical protein
VKIEEIQSVVKEITGMSPAATPKTYLDKMPKNLITLTCLTDVAEINGNIDEMGGRKSVALDISRAMCNLLCLSAVLGVDTESGIDEVIAAAREVSGGDKKGAASNDRGTVSAEKVIERERDPFFSTEKRVGYKEGIEEKVASYRTAFMVTGNEAEVEQVWKKISQDRLLDSNSRQGLWKVKTEALTRFS